jgi:SAM-dependent methyltransferase
MLPSTEGLQGIPVELWSKLHERLAGLEVTVNTLAAAQARGSGVPAGLRPPISKWHLRRQDDDGARALRCLFFGDPIPSADARRIFGSLFEPLLDGGVLEEREAGFLSPYHWDFVGNLLVLADPLSNEPQTVMGHSQTTARLCLAATPKEKLGRVLDLGCGAGAIAMVLAKHAEHVIATDINERAVVVARINLALNGIQNVEVRQGSLYEPLHAERFDLVVSQPPFIAKPETSSEVTFLYGGRRGDELALELFGGLSAHLNPTGKGIFLVEWPEVPGESLPGRIRAALLGSSQNLLVIQSPELSVDEHCAMMATTVSRNPDSPEFERDVLARRDHFARLGVEFLRSTFVITSPSRSEEPWTKLQDARMSHDVVIDASAIARLEAAAALLACGPAALLSARLRLPPGTEMREVGPDHARGVEVLLPSDRLISAQRVNVPTASLLEWVHGSESVGSAVEQVLVNTGDPSEALRRDILTTLARMLDVGLLEVA